MRKRLIAVGLAAVVALVAVASAAFAGPTGKPVTSANGNAQSIGSVITPKRLYKKKYLPGTLEVTTKLRNSVNANGVPIPTTNVRVDFDKNAKIFTKGIPTCNSAKLQNASTEVAKRECGRAVIGKGKATALLPIGEQVFTVNQVVTAFMGRPQGGKPVVLLHTYGTTPIQTTLVLIGKVTNYNKQGFGPRLDVIVPLIAGGTGALTDFNVKIDKKYKYRGKRRSFIVARCPKSRKLKTRSVFSFLDGQSTKPVYKQGCKQRPEKKRK